MGISSAKTVNGTIKLVGETFAANVEIWLIAYEDTNHSMVWFGGFTLPGELHSARLTDGSAKLPFSLELKDGRCGQFHIKSFHFVGGDNIMVQFEGSGPLK